MFLHFHRTVAPQKSQSSLAGGGILPWSATLPDLSTPNEPGTSTAAPVDGDETLSPQVARNLHQAVARGARHLARPLDIHSQFRKSRLRVRSAKRLRLLGRAERVCTQ